MLKQPLLDEYSGGYEQKALEDIADRLKFIEYALAITVGCALGNMLGMLTAGAYR
jgi:hypothetical protein